LLTCLPAVTKQRMFVLVIVAQQQYYTLYYDMNLMLASFKFQVMVGRNGEK
jgi:hypothetical protein